jgi:undecaprenyl diphosphate synthase
MSDPADDTAPPKHVAIITDGNGRWAQRRNLPIAAGHEAGARNVCARVIDAADLGISQLTVFAFSTENWRRPTGEITALMRILARYLDRETPTLHERGVRIRFVGRLQPPLVPELLAAAQRAEHLTADNSRMTLFIPLNYGGRAEIVDAARAFDGCTEAEFRTRLYDPDLLDPDLVIRTGGERRLSNYLLWQTATSQLVFRDELWPDFDRAALISSIAHTHEPASVASDHARGAAGASPP